ncbi:glycosyltransferase family 2 protein [Clostridium butyricum]|uniref:glycosyltransferase n=1 Tax=Clostridium butyricum TaxID=1492 RepID=UPI000F51FC7E|nr:glycosyltransferase [Clostridium butyricum]RQN02446.1 glycosyltransferase family 2 protein [Clostridium butyricum]
MINITFLILHYKNIDETLKCMDSIMSIVSNYNCKWNIVVVDNGSNNGTGEKLQKQYCEYSNIKVIISKINEGFSKGNNKGYSYIRNYINSDYVVVTNNDVIFHQNDFVERIDKIYNEKKFFILGPDIFIRQNKEHQSPISINAIKIKDIENELSMYKFYLDKPRLYVGRRILQNIKNNIYSNSIIFRKFYNRIFNKINMNREQQYENVVIQGACIIVSKDYLEVEEKIFSPEPFLYCEELFLYFKCMKNKYRIIYDPSIQIWHEDSASIKYISKNMVDKAKFTLPNHVVAREMLLDYLKDMSK